MASSGSPPSDAESVRRVGDAIRRAPVRPTADKPVLIGLSGGPDSSVLLHAAVQEYGPAHLIAVHVHHGLQAQADDWSEHCSRFAAAMGVRIDVHRARPLPTGLPGGVEQWARDERRFAFVAAARHWRADAVLLGHHRDDQIETVLMRLARGSGPDGLAAMVAQRSRDGLQVVRPLLPVARSTLSDYACRFNIEAVSDPSNRDLRITRNHIRHQVLPAVRQLLPGIDAALLLAASHAADAMQALQLSLFGEQGPPAELSRRALAAQSPVVAAQMLRLWLKARGLRAPGRRRLTQMMHQLVHSDAAYGEVRHDGWLAGRYRDRIMLRAASVGAGVPKSRFLWRGEQQIRPPGFSGCFRFVPAGNQQAGLPGKFLRTDDLWVSSLQMAARLRTHRAGPSRRLKQLCQEHGISRWERPELPMLWKGPQPLFVARIGLASEFACTDDGCADRFTVEWLDDSAGGGQLHSV